MRPHIVLSFSNLTGLSVDPDNPQRGIFNVTVSAHNTFVETPQNVSITIYYEQTRY